MSAALVLVLLGAPGAGKGTYCKELKAKYGVLQISTGDMFRTALKEGLPVGLHAKQFMDQGHLVPDDIVIELVRERIQRPDCQGGFILDGFPRTETQADALVDLLSKNGMKLRVTINLDVPREVILQRLTGRRMCRKCDKGNFNIYTMKPKNDGVCDYCQGELYQRDDDSEEVILNRLKVYESQTQPLISYYRSRGQLEDVPLVGDISSMVAKIFGVIEDRAGTV